MTILISHNLKKLTFGLLTIAAIISSCKQNADFKAIRKQVLDQHDQIMIDGERAMNNKMKLDTLAMTGLLKIKEMQPALDTAVEQQHIKAITKQLNAADEQMNDWMHNFSADAKGKNDDEATRYFTAEKIKVQQLDSVYKAVLKASGDYLKKFNIRADNAESGHMKMKM